MAGAIKYFVQGESTALLSATFLIAIQWLFVETAFLFIDCSGEVQELARKYFFIRIWDAPGHPLADGLQGLVSSVCRIPSFR